MSTRAFSSPVSACPRQLSHIRLLRARSRLLLHHRHSRLPTAGVGSKADFVAKDDWSRLTDFYPNTITDFYGSGTPCITRRQWPQLSEDRSRRLPHLWPPDPADLAPDCVGHRRLA